MNDKHRYHVRLCTSNIPSDVKYATLSRVWGSLDFVKLLKSNLSCFQKDIPLSSLTKTFQNTIKVVLKSGFYYLWIDSLCIIQDDADDWLKESALMANVYGGSSLNIAATGARDGNDGLFFNRDPNIVRAVNLMTPVEKQNGFGANESNEENSKLAWVCVDGAMFHRACQNLPLFQRAWIYQERFLSPRTLHFGKSQIVLECGTHLYYETFGTRPGHIVENPIRTRHHTFSLAWPLIVQDYTRSQLTISSDKLVALSGIAKYFANKYNGQYIAGIWKEHLPHALLWRARDTVNVHGTGPLPLRGPSWSWASRNGFIRYSKTNFIDQSS
ncbi:hypothetical protein NHQ30_001314 [Ciborinia camelliae]|nr:hypothetical protein NHQ30_001314 [Ciborinia camelliae]